MKENKLIARMMVILIIVLFFIGAVEGAEQIDKKDVSSAVAGNTVKVHYTLTVDGNVVDSSKEREPMEFQIGNQQVIPGFEDAIKGMKVGDKKSFKVNPEEGYGIVDPKAIQEVSRDKMPNDLKLKSGMTIYARGKDNYPIPVKVVDVKEDTVILNFNHPLAGKTLKFDVEIIDIL